MKYNNFKRKLDILVKVARQSANTALEKAEDKAKATRMKLDIYKVQSEIDRDFLEIGKLIYEKILKQENIELDNPDINRRIQEINKHKERIEKIKSVIDELNKKSK